MFDIEFSDATMNFCNLNGVVGFVNRSSFLNPNLLSVAKSLRGAILPNGKQYSGEYHLDGDIAKAKANKVDANDQKAMREYYKKGAIELHSILPEHRKNWTDKYSKYHS